MNRNDLQALADLRVDDALMLVGAGRFSAAYYLLGYAVECALKACVTKQIKQYDFPDKQLVLDSYTHHLENLLRISGVKPQFDMRIKADKSFEVNWTTVKDWTEAARYSAKCCNRSPEWYSDMAQDTVVKESLTDAMIQAGAELTKKLDELQWPVLASLWLYEPEGNQWKLLLASPRVTSDGPKKSYETIQSALTKIPVAEGTLALSDIGVTDPNHPLIALLRMAVRTGPTIGSIRFTRNVIDGHFIEDAYIYRVSDTAPTGQAA